MSDLTDEPHGLIRERAYWHRERVSVREDLGVDVHEDYGVEREVSQEEHDVPIKFMCLCGEEFGEDAEAALDHIEDVREAMRETHDR